ncbi:MAG: hypothetical protein ABUS79_31765, partial [Pseudomonadota bacterium]
HATRQRDGFTQARGTAACEGVAVAVAAAAVAASVVSGAASRVAAAVDVRGGAGGAPSGDTRADAASCASVAPTGDGVLAGCLLDGLAHATSPTTAASAAAAATPRRHAALARGSRALVLFIVGSSRAACRAVLGL